VDVCCPAERSEASKIDEEKIHRLRIAGTQNEAAEEDSSGGLKTSATKEKRLYLAIFKADNSIIEQEGFSAIGGSLSRA